jgi:GTP-binding protein HflX
VAKRITFIKDQLSQVHRHRQLHRDHRRERNAPIIALVGYTNAGKSTLLNSMSGAEVLAEDKLFATLDPTTRRIELNDGRQALLTDTVGFINKLPTLVIAAFRATLEEIAEASVLIHVLDVTHPNAREHAETVNHVLEEIGVDDKPVVVALNKIDRCGHGGVPTLDELIESLPLVGTKVPISAQQRLGFEELRTAVTAAIDTEREIAEVTLKIPYAASHLVERFYRVAAVSDIQHDDVGTTVTGRIASYDLDLFANYLVSEPVIERAITPLATRQEADSAA